MTSYDAAQAMTSDYPEGQGEVVPPTNDHGPVVYLHIGAPKSGTTFLQKMLWHNRSALARDGVLYPAEHTGDHFRAALDLRGVRFRGYEDPAVPGSWQRAVDLTHRWHGPTVVLSHELLAWANEEKARSAVESLRPAEVHVVYTARDLARQLPAMWQEVVKNGNVPTFRQYLRSVEAPQSTGRFGRGFWRAQDAVAVLGRWQAAVPPDRIHVITVPRPGAPSDLLWNRFADLLGVEPQRYEAPLKGSNVSLGRAEVELLRRINLALDGGLEWPEYEALIKRGLAENVLAMRQTASRIVLPPAWHAWVVERSEQLVEGLREGGYDIVGDLDELRPPQEPAASPPPKPDEVLGVAAETIAHLLLEWGDRQPGGRRWLRPVRSRIAETARRLGTRPTGVRR